MSDIGEVYKCLKAVRQQERADNRSSAPRRLREAGIEFSSHNDGSHLVIKGRFGCFDFWPGTELWKMRGQRKAKRNYGIEELIKRILDES